MRNPRLAADHLRGKDFDELALAHGVERSLVRNRVLDYLLLRHGLSFERIQTMSDEERRALADKINPLTDR